MNNTQSKTLLTEGSIWKKMVAFALPLFFGNLFQQLYNTADSLIVGNFLGSNALAAVSSSGSLIFLLVGFFNGIAMGAGVVIARYYGAREINELQKAIHTTVVFGILCGLVLMTAGLILAPQILIWMRTPKEVLPESTAYFRVYFIGSLAFVLYNNFVGILQSVGDSRHPLYYLIFSSAVNIVLDLLFVGVLHFGVASAAAATVISQFVSAALCLYRLMYKSPDDYRISFGRLQLNPFMLKQIVKNGLPAGIQNSVISIANVFVQSNINSFGKIAMAGCGSYSKIEGFGFLPITCFSMAVTTFISQNLGARQYDRVKPGRAVWNSLWGISGRACRDHPVSGGAAAHRFVRPESGGHRLWCAAGKNDHAVLFPAGLFSYDGGNYARSRKGNGSDARNADLLVPDPSDLYYDRSADLSGD